ncbi:MAG: GNAT family N-acetyltransferase [Saprospiraceae bacterium]|nr:GNAT family N-acetyltransferase [Saprospiraceae bacterium]HMW39322.1 GNAT family protein [Saprospiraceae bacterium]HMX88632.1 GNAT family protein [Saprospiraceae bacterium]HMZ40211.1 GNAT family protein [Saprospiraceae bacterium]HNB30459.1 GNAT family protein [Saprospiraceae bacterium]
MEINYTLIDTPHLTLKGLTPKIMNDIFAQLSKVDIMRVLGHHSDDDYVAEEKKYLGGYSSYNRSFLLFLLVEKSSDIIIGRCGFHNWNDEHQRAELGYVMTDQSFRNKGFMSEAVEAVLNYGFNVLRLNRIEALVGRNNIPSLKIMRKFGFVQEGCMRRHYNVDGVFEDSLVFSILEEEYNKQ